MSDRGFIVIDRKITEWRWWKNNTARGLWLYLLVNANWKTGFNSDGTEIKRGQVCRSLRNIAADNDVNIKTIRYWLKKFEETGEIEVIRAHRYNVICIVNYAKYQDVPTDKGTITGTNTGTNTGTITGTITGTDRTIVTKKQSNKETIKERDKRDKAVRFVPPSQSEVADYAHEIGFDSLNAQYFLDYYESKGWMIGKNHMKSWKAAVRTWKTRDQGKEANHAEPERKPEESEYTPEALRRAGFSPIESADDFERVFGVTLTDEERNIGKK